MSIGLRNLAALWTDDGLIWHRRFVIGPDAWDPLGTQFYSMGMLQEAESTGDLPGRGVLDRTESKINQAFRRRNLYLGSALLHWGLDQSEAPELIWTRDFIQFHRFTDRRSSIVPQGEGGRFDRSMVRERYRYWEFDGEWWYYYTGINTRHNGDGIMARHPDMEDVKTTRWNHRRAKYFTTGEGHFADGKATRYLPGIARMKPYRFAHAEPVDARGTLMTRPIRVEAQHLTLNGATKPDGLIKVSVFDSAGETIATSVFRGDEAAAEIADAKTWKGDIVQLRFELHRARLYAFLI